MDRESRQDGPEAQAIAGDDALKANALRRSNSRLRHCSPCAGCFSPGENAGGEASSLRLARGLL